MKTERSIRADIVNHISHAGLGNTPLNLSIVEIIKTAAEQRKTGDNLFVNHHLMPVWNVTGKPGSMGNLSKAVGAAIANKMDGNERHTIAIVTDTDHHQGHYWEALMLANNHKLSNLTVIVNRTNMQADGYTEQAHPLEPLMNKYDAFGWHSIEIDGHNTEHITQALNEARNTDRPSVIIAHTIPGKGTFMEHDHTWQHKKLSQQDAERAHRDLRTS